MEEHKDEREELNRQEENPHEETEHEGTQEYSFLQETIKDEAGGRSKVRKDIFRMILFGLLFGLAASAGFCAFQPWFEKTLQSDDPKQVTIPQEEEEEDVAAQEEEQAEPVQILDADSYRQMQQSLTGIATEASRAVVEITGVIGEQDWMEESYGNKNRVSGLIVADNGQELLIFGKTSILEDASDIQVKFPDGRSYQASLKKQDGNLGFGIYAVSKSGILESTWAQIKTATLGSSNSVVKGETAIVLGSPFGYWGGIGFGTVASNKNYKEAADGAYRLVCTDIAGAKNGSGVIVNLKGEVIGMIDQEIFEEESLELITGFGISDMKTVIEFLSNGQGVPYIGIHGVDVTDEIEEQGIPNGIYVKEVEVDSPAMAAGIQSGDIITSISGKEVENMTSYHAVLMEKKSGNTIKIRGKRQGAGGYVNIDFSVTVGSKE